MVRDTEPYAFVVVADVRGHADEAFTLRTYVHLMPNSFERARTAVDAMFKPRRQAATDTDTG